MRRTPIVGYNMDTELTVTFDSIRQFARYIDGNQTKRCTAQRRIAKGGGLVPTRKATWYVEAI